MAILISSPQAYRIAMPELDLPSIDYLRERKADLERDLGLND